MNHADHHKVVELAVPALPEDSRRFWAPLTGSIAAACMLPDQFAIPLLNGEDGPWRRYFPAAVPLHSFEKLGAAARAHFFDLRFYVERIVALLRAGDVAEACRFLGVLSHHLGDFGEPAHYYEHEITLLLPPPPERLNCNPHRMLEDTVSSVTAIRHAPRVLGDSVDTIVPGLEGRLRELYELALAAILPMLSAAYRRDPATAAAAVDPVIAETAAVMADLLHTFCCLHTGLYTSAERAALAACRLDLLEPAAYDVEFNYGCRPLRGAICLDQVGHALPLQLRLCAAGRDEVRAVDGLCLIPHALPLRGTQYLAAVEFDLPSGTYTRFTCTAGLLAGYAPQAVCRFRVIGDGRARSESEPMGAGDAAVTVDIDVSGVRRLRLEVRTDGSTDKLAMPIWGWPTVHRAAVAGA